MRALSVLRVTFNLGPLGKQAGKGPQGKKVLLGFQAPVVNRVSLDLLEPLGQRDLLGKEVAPHSYKSVGTHSDTLMLHTYANATRSLHFCGPCVRVFFPGSPGPAGRSGLPGLPGSCEADCKGSRGPLGQKGSIGGAGV